MHADAPGEVVVGIETNRGDERMLADLVRTDRHHHRRVAGDSGLAEAVKVLARGHQQLVTRCPPLRRRPPGSWRHHHQALRALANRLIGIIHGCLRHHRPYDEQLAWPTSTADAAA